MSLGFFSNLLFREGLEFRETFSMVGSARAPTTNIGLEVISMDPFFLNAGLGQPTGCPLLPKFGLFVLVDEPPNPVKIEE